MSDLNHSCNLHQRGSDCPSQIAFLTIMLQVLIKLPANCRELTQIWHFWVLILDSGHIYAAFRIRPDEGILVDRMLRKHWIQMCLGAFLPLKVRFFRFRTHQIFFFQGHERDTSSVEFWDMWDEFSRPWSRCSSPFTFPLTISHSQISHFHIFSPTLSFHSLLLCLSVCLFGISFFISKLN